MSVVLNMYNIQFCERSAELNIQFCERSAEHFVSVVLNMYNIQFCERSAEHVQYSIL